MSRNKGILLVIASALLYGFAPVLCSMTYQYGNNPVTLTFFRSFFVVLLLAFLMKKNGISFFCEKSELIKVVGVACFGAVLTTLLLNSSYLYIGVGTATTLHFMYPLFVTLICHFVYHDPLSRKHMIALGIALCGVLLFLDFKDLSKMKGIMMALISGVTFAIYLVGIDKLKLSRMNSLKLSFYFALTVSVIMGTSGLAANQLVLNQPFISYALMFAVAIMAQWLAVVCLQKGIDVLGSSLASLFSMFEPVSCLVFGAIFLNETVVIAQVIGSGLILGGVLLLVKE
ncbi:MAG: DMT family transporter [Erysipelotrichaceae bacterium]|nr:DMT family transporter [Erysipelotrichaceae bacterium]